MPNLDQPLAILMLLTVFLLLGLLIAKKNTVPIFVAAMLPVMILFIYFSVGYRITEMSLASGTIKLASDQAQKYASEIREIKNNVIEDNKTIARVLASAQKTDGIVAQIDEKSSAATLKLLSVEDQLIKSRNLLTELEGRSNFDSLVFAAQSDDRSAFERLKSIGADFNSPFHERAASAWKAIRTQMNSISAMKVLYTINWAPGFDPAKLGLEALSQLFFQAEKNTGVADFEMRAALVDYISMRQDFSKDKRLLFDLNAMRTTSSIKLFAYAASDFNQIAEAKSGDLTSLTFYENWWNSHPHE